MKSGLYSRAFILIFKPMLSLRCGNVVKRFVVKCCQQHFIKFINNIAIIFTVLKCTNVLMSLCSFLNECCHNIAETLQKGLLVNLLQHFLNVVINIVIIFKFLHCNQAFILRLYFFKSMLSLHCRNVVIRFAVSKSSATF